jgi:hypothetical protein
MISWPGVTAGGTVSDALVQSEDLYPTILQMAGLPPRPAQALDALSMVPAICGQAGLREAVYCYFPHSPTVPEWQPPSVCMRKGDWKLIRIFYDAPNGGHRYELYNLAMDIGERNNLAASQPERVEAMDTLIEKFMRDTDAVIPVPNPVHDPAAFDSVSGWKSGGDGRISLSYGLFHLRSFGKDPQMTTAKPLKLTEGRYTLEMRVRSWAGGEARFFWGGDGEENGGESSQAVGIKADGLWHEYRTELDFTQSVNRLRFNPASTDGSVSIEWIRLLDRSGSVAAEWDFKKGPPPRQEPNIKIVPQIAVGGWKGGHNSHLALSAKEGVLHLQSKGGDPMLISEPLSVPKGEYIFTLRMKSNSKGGGLLFARPPQGGYLPGSGKSFSVIHDNQWHELRIPFISTNDFTELRLDPCSAPGVLDIEWIRLGHTDGRVIHDWKFKGIH